MSNETVSSPGFMEVEIDGNSPLYESIKELGSFFNDTPAPDPEWLNVRYGIFTDAHLKGAPGAGGYKVTIHPGDNILKLIAALRAGKLSPASLKIDFDHDSPPL